MKHTTHKKEENLLADILEVAKYLYWNNEVGDTKASVIINDIHNGKYGSREGVWIQAEKALDDMLLSHQQLIDEVESKVNQMKHERADRLGKSIVTFKDCRTDEEKIAMAGWMALDDIITLLNTIKSSNK